MSNDPATELFDLPPSSTPRPNRRSKRARRGSSEKRAQVVLMQPSRRPAWRWNLAGEIVAFELRAPRTSLDPRLADVIRFRRSLERATSTAKLASIERRYPDLFKAWEIYERNGLARWRLEARILAKQSQAEIATLEGLAVGVVHAYEAALFDVRSRLRAFAWVFLDAIGPNFEARREANETSVVLSTFAFMMGPKILDLLLTAAVDGQGRLVPPRPMNLETVEGRLAARAQLAVALFAGPTDLTRLGELVRFQSLILDAQRAADLKQTIVAPISSELTPSPSELVEKLGSTMAVSVQDAEPSEGPNATTSDESREAGEAA